MAASSRPSKKKADTDDTESRTLEKEALKKLIQIMLDIFDNWEGIYGVKSKRANPLRAYITNYQKLLNPKHFDFHQDHAPLFRKLFESHRKLFLGILDEEGFLGSKSLQVWYGEGVRSTEKKNYRLPISAAYKKAAQMRNDLDENKPKDPELAAEVESQLEYVLAGEYLYRLMDVILLALPEDHSDREALQEITKELREMSGLENEQEALTNGFGSICQDLYGLARKVGGMPGGEDGEDGQESSMPPIGVMSSAMERLFSNKKVLGGIANATSNIAELFSEDTAPEDAYGKAFDTIVPSLREAFVEVVKPPPGVEVSAKSQAEAERMAQNFDNVVGGISAVMKKINPGDILEGVEGMVSGMQEAGQDDEAAAE